MKNLIGRKTQQAEIERLYNSGRPELLVVYGRRRVGKTFLVDETLKGKLTFRHAGLSPIEKGGNALKHQLQHFFFSLKHHGWEGEEVPNSWLKAFFMLEQLLISKDDGSRQVVFLDELPWMDTPRSGFLTAFESFWNGWASHRDNMMLVVCGSANSWILDNMIGSHGGLYGRTTYEIKLSPFNLAECREFYESRNINFSDYDIVQTYMVLGGIPYYMNYIRGNLSFEQNMDNLFQGPDARFRNEFERLFESAFDSPESIIKLVEFIGSRGEGFTRKEIIKGVGMTDGGLMSKRLRALVASDFIKEYVPFGLKKRELHYKLIDPFCNFHLHFLKKGKNSKDIWTTSVSTPRFASWRGIAFELVCFNHIPQIKYALGISGVISEESSWKVPGNDNREGMQIDMIIIRKDDVANVCEMKFYNREFSVDKDYDLIMRNRRAEVAKLLPKRFSVRGTLVTTFGLTRGKYASVFSNVVTIADLFQTWTPSEVGLNYNPQ